MKTKRRKSAFAARLFKNHSGSNAVTRPSAGGPAGITSSAQGSGQSLRRSKTSSSFAISAREMMMRRRASLPTRSSSQIDLHNIILQIIIADQMRPTPTSRMPPSRRSRGNLGSARPRLRSYAWQSRAALQSLLIFGREFIWCWALWLRLVDGKG